MAPRRVDDYHWLRNKDSRAVISHLKSENAYTAAMMKPSQRLQKTLYKEMLARIKETDVDVPYREGDYFYYSRTRKGKQYRIFCRRRGQPRCGRGRSSSTPTKRRRATSSSRWALLDVSPDGNLLAFSSDVTGFREYTLQVKDLRNGSAAARAHRESPLGRLGHRQPHAVLCREDGAKRAYRLYRHLLGSNERRADVRGRPTRAFRISVSRRAAVEYLFLTSHSATTSEVRYSAGGCDPA